MRPLQDAALGEAGRGGGREGLEDCTMYESLTESECSLRMGLTEGFLGRGGTEGRGDLSLGLGLGFAVTSGASDGLTI